MNKYIVMNEGGIPLIFDFGVITEDVFHVLSEEVLKEVAQNVLKNRYKLSYTIVLKNESGVSALVDTEFTTHQVYDADKTLLSEIWECKCAQIVQYTSGWPESKCYGDFAGYDYLYLDSEAPPFPAINSIQALCV